MAEPQSDSQHLSRFRWHTVSYAAIWIAIILVSLVWNLRQHHLTTIELAALQARTVSYKDLAYRKWNKDVGGVYVEVSNTVQPNPYLSALPERDITTTKGKRLTLVNAAYMNRMVYEQEKATLPIISRITSLKPLVESNGPDPWERKALEQFESGEQEVIDVTEILGEPYVRLMEPLLVDESCLHCHYSHGYKEGQIIGGLSVSVPLKPTIAATASQKGKIWFSHMLALALGLAFIYMRGRDILTRANALIESERESQRARRAAVEANAAKSRFLANMSHELRTPLNSITGMTELAMEETSVEVRREYLSMVKQSSTALLHIVNEILDHAKIEQGALSVEHTPMDLHATILDAAGVIEIIASQKSLAFDVEIADSVPRHVIGDSLRVRQVLINVLGNAVKFTQEGLVSLKVERAASDTGIDTQLFTVCDTGVGIPEERLDRIFESFTQADNSTTRKFGGTGLGLTISRDLIHLMGGEIRVESEPGKGSTFYFSIPFAPVSAPITSGRALDRQLRVLVVDDNNMNRRVATATLKKLGHAVEDADSGRAALLMLETQRFDAVLMDIQMPEIDGIETTRLIRQSSRVLDPKVPVIAITASISASNISLYKSRGFDFCLAKPLDIRALASALELTVVSDPV